MSNRDHIQSTNWFGSILDSVNNSCSGQEQDNHNQNWNNRPGQLDLGASVDLSRLAASISCLPTEPNDGVDE